MSELQDVPDIADQLKVEQERVSKLKQIIIREKKNGAQLKNELDHLTTELEELKHQNSALESELTQLKSSKKSSATDMEVTTEPTLLQQGKHAVDSQVQDRLHEFLVQVEQLNNVVIQKDAMIDELQSKLDTELTTFTSELNDRVNRIKDLEAELASFQCLKSQVDELSALLSSGEKRECKLRSELDDCQLKLSLEIEKTSQLRKVIDSMDVQKCTAEQLDAAKLENERLFLELSNLREQCKVHNSLLAESQQEVITLSSSLDTLRKQLDSLVEKNGTEKNENDVLRNYEERSFGTLVEQLCQLLSDMDYKQLNKVEDEQLFRKSVCLLLHGNSSAVLMNGICYSSTCPACGNCYSQSINVEQNLSPIHQTNVTQSKSYPTLSDSVEPSISIPENTEALPIRHGSVDNVEFNDDSHERLRSLETKVRELELYTVELVERAKLQAAELLQKVVLQKSDYDHLIRDKDMEISELRETCDRLVDETSAYCNFCYSLMTFYCATCVTSSPKENLTDWSMVATTLKANDGTVESHRLMEILDLFAQELRTHLDRNENADNNPTEAELQSCQNSEEISHLQNNLNETLALLEQEKERASRAEVVANEASEQLQKQEDKIGRMKALLLRLKQDEQQHRKTCSALEEAEQTMAELKVNLEDKQQELERVCSDRKHFQQLSNSLRTDLIQYQSTIEDLKGERDFAVDRLNKLQNEFNAYKVKALHTLRGVQPSHDVIPPPALTSESSEDSASLSSTTPIFSNELDQLNEQIASMKQLAEEESLRASLARTECDLIREELVESKRKYGEILKEFNEQQQRWEAQLAVFVQERGKSVNNREKELEEKLESERQRFDSLLLNAKTEHQKSVSEERSMWAARLEKANKHIQSLEEQLETFQRPADNPTRLHHPESMVTPTPDLPSPFSAKFLYNRMQGDGADNVATVQNHLSGGNELRSPLHSPAGSFDSHSGVWPTEKKMNGNRPFLPLDQLLSSANADRPPNGPMSASGMSSPRSSRTFNAEFETNGASVFSDPASAMQVAGLRNALQNQQRRVEHLSELLHESEATVGRLEEQVKVLKDEIRRLEQLMRLGTQFPLPNQSPQPDSSSKTNTNENEVPQSTVPKDAILRTEYLKNVILKLLSLPSDSSERAQLTTVLSTMLMLTPSESQLLQQHQQPTQPNSGASWSSYLLGWRS